METNLFISNFKKWPWPFMAGLLVFTLLQVALAQSPAFWNFIEKNCRFHDDDPLRLESMLHTMARETSFKKVLILGTSQAREDIDTHYLNEHFKSKNIRFYNLGVPGSSFPIDNFMLKERIIAVQPEAIIYTPFIESFYTRYKEQPANNLEFFFNPTIIPYLVKHVRAWIYDRDFRADLLDAAVGSVSLFYRFRDQFGHIFLSNLKYTLSIAKRPPPKDTYFAERLPESYFAKQIEEAKKNERYQYSRHTELNQEIFSVFAQDLISKRIQFIVLDCPMHPLMSKIVSPELTQGYHDFLFSKSSQIGFTYIPATELSRFSAGEFYDFTHLTREGRTHFTQVLADYLEKTLKVSR